MSNFLPILSISSSQSTDMVKEKCEGKNFCELEAANEVYGNPCGQTHKYLEVNFHCQAGKNISKFFCVIRGATGGRFSNNAAWSSLLKHYKSTVCWSNSRSGGPGCRPRPSRCFLRQGTLLHFVSLHQGV